MRTVPVAKPPPAEAGPAEEKPAPPQAGPALVPRFVMKRMHDRPSNEVLQFLAKAPSLMLDKSAVRLESIELIRARAADLANMDVTPALLSSRADLTGLPLRRGALARLTGDAVQHLSKGAHELQHTRTEDLAAKLAGDPTWLQAARVPALMQVLMVEPLPGRVSLARHLANIPGQRASTALVQMTLFDPEAEVRQEAVAALERRPIDEYRALLLSGFTSPWPVAAEHAAEALVALKRREAVPALLAVLNGPDPQAPYAKDNGTVRYVKDFIRINHKLNCLLCHPVSFSDNDPLRRSVPSFSEVKGGASFSYSLGARAPTKHAFVRADVTYVRQDYSVMLQGNRYDLVSRERVSTPADALAAQARKSEGLTPHQKAAAFALHELLPEVPGPDVVPKKGAGANKF